MNIQEIAGALPTSGDDSMFGKLASVAMDLTKAGTDLLAMSDVFSGIPQLTTLAVPVALVGKALADAGQKLAGLDASATSANIAEPGLEGGESSEGGEDAEGSEGLQASLEEKKTLYANYFQTLIDLQEKQSTTAEERRKKERLNEIKNLGLLVGETILGSKKVAKIQRAIARAEVVRKGALAIMEATKSLPWPLNLPAIAFAKVTGKQQEAAVNQAHDGLDYIPKTGTFLLEKGERVIGKRLNHDLSSFLTASNQALAGDTIDRSVTRSSTFNPTINLTVGGGAGDDMLLANRGAIETMIREIYADYALQSPFGA